MANGIYDVNGIRTTTVSGTSFTGLFAADGSYNIVLDDASHTGLYHPCGAWRVSSASNSNQLTYDASGAYYLSTLLGRPGNSAPLTPYIGQLATRCMPPNSLTSLGATSFIMARSRHFARDTITTAAIVLPGWYYSHSAGPAEAALGGTATVTASFEYPVGTFTQITFSSSASGTVTSNASLTSDQVAVSIPVGAAFFVRVFWSSTTGILYQATNNDGLTPTSTNMQSNDVPNGEIVHYGSSGITDQTMGGTITNTDPNGTIGFSPVAIIGPTTRPSFYIMGDSRSRGLSDFYSDSSSNIGQGSRIIGPSNAYINGGCTGILAQNWTAGFPNQKAIAALCSHIYCELGINDLSNAVTSSTLITSLQNIWTTYGASRVVQATLPPETTSTDAWLTTANQTIAAWDAQRTTFNDAVRAGIAGTIGFIEIADVAEGGRNLGKWRVDTITAQFTATQAAGVVNVSAVGAGTLHVGDVVGSNGVIDRKFIQSLGTGTGLTGTYNVSGSQTIGSATPMVANPAVTDGIHETSVMNNLYLSSGVFNSGNYTIANSPQATAFLARTSSLNATETAAYAALINGMVADGTWSLLDALYIFATNTTTTANLNLVSTNYGLTKTGTVTFAADVGYTGDGSTGFLNTGYNPSTAGGHLSLNSATIGVYIQSTTAVSTKVAIGAAVAGSFLYIVPVQTGSFFWDANAATFPSFVNANPQGAWVVSRTGATATGVYKNSSSTAVGTSNDTSVSLPTQPIYIHALNSAGAAANFDNYQISAAFIGGGMTGAQAAAVNNRINTFMASNGSHNIY